MSKFAAQASLYHDVDCVQLKRIKRHMEEQLTGRPVSGVTWTGHLVVSEWGHTEARKQFCSSADASSPVMRVKLHMEE